MRKRRRKRPGHSAGRHTPHTASGSSLSAMVWLVLRKEIKSVYAIYLFFFFVNNSDLFMGCKLYTVNVAQRQDIILLPAGKREGKNKRKRQREGEREEERHRESEEAVSFCNPPCTSCIYSKRYVVCKKDDTENERHMGPVPGARSFSFLPAMLETCGGISE